jgi:hypothetical protein
MVMAVACGCFRTNFGGACPEGECRRPAGASCDHNSECLDTCIDETCAVTSGTGGPCDDASDCPSGFACTGSVCAAPFPRLAALVTGNPQNYESLTFRDMALKYHMVVLSHWDGWQGAHGMPMAEVMQDIKDRSSVGTRLLIMLSLNDWNNPSTNDPVFDKLEAENWWLYVNGTQGALVTGGGRTYCNTTSWAPADAAGLHWLEWLAEYYYRYNVAGDANNDPNPVVDGFVTNGDSVAPRVDGDWNRDGSTDSNTDVTVQGWYRDGQLSFYDRLSGLWPDALRMGTADWGDATANAGVLDQELEGGKAPTFIGQTWSVETWGGFDVMMTQYRKIMDSVRTPKLFIFHQELAAADAYQDVRYGLASALMDDGFFAASAPSPAPEDLPWFDEYEAVLGLALEARRETAWSQGVWRRDFENGIALVNPKGNGAQTVSLGATFTKLLGTQDPVTNDGSQVSSVTLADRDGILLLR